VIRKLGSFLQPSFNRLPPYWLCSSGATPVSHLSQLLVCTALILQIVPTQIGFVWRRSPGLEAGAGRPVSDPCPNWVCLAQLAWAGRRRRICPPVRNPQWKNWLCFARLASNRPPSSSLLFARSLPNGPLTTVHVGSIVNHTTAPVKNKAEEFRPVPADCDKPLCHRDLRGLVLLAGIAERNERRRKKGRSGSGGNRCPLSRNAIRRSGPSVWTRGYVGSWAERSQTAHRRTKPAIHERCQTPPSNQGRDAPATWRGLPPMAGLKSFRP
jgi:hypothetical protein